MTLVVATSGQHAINLLFARYAYRASATGPRVSHLFRRGAAEPLTSPSLLKHPIMRLDSPDYCLPLSEAYRV